MDPTCNSHSRIPWNQRETSASTGLCPWGGKSWKTELEFAPWPSWVVPVLGVSGQAWLWYCSEVQEDFQGKTKKISKEKPRKSPGKIKKSREKQKKNFQGKTKKISRKNKTNKKIQEKPRKISKENQENFQEKTHLWKGDLCPKAVFDNPFLKNPFTELRRRKRFIYVK